MEASKEEVSKSSKANVPISINTAASVANNAASEFLRQRALLEKERLERNKGRLPTVASGSAASGSGRMGKGTQPGHKRTYSASQSDDDDEDDLDGRPSKRKAIIGSTSKSLAGPSSGSGKLEGEVFYEHELRQTANQHTEASDKRKGVKTFRLTEIIGEKKEVAFAILSSYSTDVAWLYSLFDPKV